MRIQLYLFFSLFLFQSSFAATFTAIASGEWGDGSTWDQGGLVPGSGDDVLIAGYTVQLRDYTGDVTVRHITITNITGSAQSRLFIYENVTLNANSITLEAENRVRSVELQIFGQAVVIISGKLKLERKNDNNKQTELLFYLHGNANVTVGDDFEYNYRNGGNSENMEEIRIEGSAQLNLNRDLVLTKADGGGQFNMFLAGGADIFLAGMFNITQEDGGDFNVIIQDSSTFTIGGTATFQNKSAVNQLNITIDQLDGFVYFTDEVHFDSNNDDNLVFMEAYGNSILRLADDLRMTGGTEGDIGLILGDTARLEIAGRLLRPDKFGFIRGTEESEVVFNGTGTPTLDYSDLASSGTDSIFIAKMTLNNTSGSPVVLDADLEVSGHLELMNGVLETSPTAKLIIKDGATISEGSTTSYIDGPVLKEGSTNGTSFIFPTGDGGVYAPLEISPVTNPALPTRHNTILNHHHLKME